MNDFYYFSQQVDEDSETDLTLYRSAFFDITVYGRFVDAFNEKGIEFAKPLLSQLKFHWSKEGVNAIGDMMSGFIFSEKAAHLIKSLRVDFKIFEPINIEGTPAYFIFVNKIPELSESLDIFNSVKHRKSLIVSQAFKDAWNSAALLGAEFSPINHEQLENK
ncbi:MAG: hypothetical protein CTY38_00950 [Methylotenera sp.]|uniref:hypothetical protein n=1 Tax=Methylotenera sp. TaxID=2051956 RepID=UPI000D4A7E7F|nr:hypothetical protein [Methylotenera sp.]PPC84646.1 MAG: hypothetical protein CTY38_00950 [Methylotenera sp.]